MPAKKQVPKEKILAAALELLKTQGYEAVNIKQLSKALGCSTQPVYLSFSGMDELRGGIRPRPAGAANPCLPCLINGIVSAFRCLRTGSFFLKNFAKPRHGTCLGQEAASHLCAILYFHTSIKTARILYLVKFLQNQ